MSIGHSPHVSPHKPDMKKDQSEVTDREREEAKRRIEGSLAPEREGPPTGGTAQSVPKAAAMH
jgi:phosphatidylserine decarboxylase